MLADTKKLMNFLKRILSYSYGRVGARLSITWENPRYEAVLRQPLTELLYDLYLRINIANNSETTNLVEKVLQSIDTKLRESP